MANVFKPKRSNTASNPPTTSNTTSGEMAVNMADQKIYINNGTSIVQIGAGTFSALSNTSLATGTGLPVSTGISGLGTGIATALAANVGSAGAPVTFNGAGGTPSSLTLTNATGLPVAGGGTGATTLTANGILYGNGTAAVGITAVGTAAQVLTSNGAGVAPTFQTSAGGVPTTITVANEATDTTCFPAFFTAATGDLGPKSNAGFTFNSATGALGIAADSTINGVSVGRGVGGVTTSTSVGRSALTAVNGANSTAVGFEALKVLTGGECTAVGAGAMSANTTGLGDAHGYQALFSNTTGGSSISNCAFGFQALRSNTTGQGNSAFGGVGSLTNSPLYDCTTGGRNSAFGPNSLMNVTTGSYNSEYGLSSGENITTGSGNICIGDSAGVEAAVINITTENNRIALGQSAITNFYCKVLLTVTSDARDKTDIAPVTTGLSFVQQLKPVSFRFKASREDPTPTGDVRYGFLAQDILALEGANSVIVDSHDANNLKYVDGNMTAVLVKAIQELKAEFDAYKLTHP